MDILLFQIGPLRCAIPAADVREVLRALALGPLPSAPEAILGIFSLRGTVVPVLDLHWRFRLPPRQRSHTDNVIVAQAPERFIGMWVDRVLDLHTIDPASYEAARRVAPEAAHVAGVVQLDSDLVLICDLARFLDRQESIDLGLALARLAPRPQPAP